MPFEIIDHVVFYGSMAFSLGIGVYFGFWKKSHTSDGYLLANRQMKVIPITISMVASSISGITLLGYSGEVYVYGANNVWTCLSCVVASVIGGCMFVPVLTKLKSPNVFEYFELRFDRRTKILASCAYTLYVLFFSSVVAYAPAIAFSQVTAVHPQIVASLVCVVCVFYTTVGGFRAVVWTDVFQFFGIIAGVIVVAVLGIASVGGVGAVIEKASNGHRLNFNIDPTQRDGFWQMLLGSTTTWIFILSLQPGTVQKYLSLSTSKNVTRVMVLQCFGIATISFVSIFMGLIVYAKYDGCDPLTTGEVARSDQILPYFLVDVVRDIPGLSGIFIAGLFSASLSTLSASLNTLGATVYGDLMSLHVFRGIMKDKESLILKLIVVGSGGICTALTCVVQHMGGIIPFAMVIVGLLNGIFCGLFSLGMIFPRANSKGAFCGVISTFLGVGIIIAVNQWYTLQGASNYFAKPMSVANCSVSVNVTLSRTQAEYEPFVLFRISLWYNPVMGFLMVIVVGMLVSYCTKPDVYDPNLLSPIYRKTCTNPKLSQKYSAGMNSNHIGTYNFERNC